jgi:adenosylcobinamide-GDP ribazoletransferase
MREFYLGFKFSLSYFSNFPISFREDDNLSTKRVLASMLFSLPLVGLFLGLATVLIFLLLSKLNIYGAVISAVFYMMLYGFIHTEAIIDVADAVYAKHSGKDAYQIIKESTVGAMGVLYGVGFLIIKLSAILYLFTHNLLEEFIAVLLISRFSLTALIYKLDFKSSFINLLKESLNIKYLISSLFLTLLIGSILIPYFIAILLFGLLLSYLISIYLGKKLGFINGDILGATLEGVEILLFLLLALLI